MKIKYMVGYCPTCEKETKHEIIGNTGSLGFRIFEHIVTFGLAITMPYDYHCECTKCKEINTLTK